MSKQVYIDSEGNEILLSGTVNSADMMPMSVGDATKVSEAIGNLYYDVDDSFSLNNAILTGYTSNSSQRVQFFVPISKPLSSNITSANITGDFTMYSENLSETITNSSATGSWTAALRENGIFFRFDLNSQFATTTRSVVAVLFGSGAKITFT